MKPTPFILLLAAVATAPLSVTAIAQSPPPPPPPPAPPTSSSTSIDTVIEDGKGKITVTIERDGQKETRTINLTSDDPAKLAEQVAEELRASAGLKTGEAPTRKVTYLGVMFAEEADRGFGSGMFRVPGMGDRGGSSRGEGESIRPSQPGEAAAPGLPPGTGLAISGVSPGSPAEKAGLQAGDVLARLDDQILVNSAQFTTLIRNRKEGDSIKLAIVRNGEPKDMEIALAAREQSSPQVFGYGSGGIGRGGALRFSDGTDLAGGKFGPGFREGRILRLEKDGRVIEERVGDVAPSPPIPPSPPLAPDAAPKAGALNNFLPQWEKALRDAADVREHANEQWKAQLAEWRQQWSMTQEKTAEDYRRAMAKMGEEIRKASEAAREAQEEARRAIDAWRDQRAQEKPADKEAEESKPADAPKESPPTDQPKKILSTRGFTSA